MANNTVGGPPLKGLYLEDAPRDAELVRELLGAVVPALALDCAANKEEFRAALEKGGYDFILADFKVPGFDGFASLKMANKLLPGVPVICVSGAIGEETAVGLLKAGVADFIFKDRPARLPAAISRAVSYLAAKSGLRLAHAAVEATARDWQSTFDTISDAVWVLDADHRIVRSNRAADLMFKLKPGSIKGRYCYEIAHGKNEPIENCPFEHARATMRRERVEVPVGEKTYEIIVDPVADKDGKFTSGVHIMTDITERKRAEAELKMLNTRLETRVRERTARLEEANKELEAFSYSVSHDLRAPLRHVSGYVELLVGRCREGLTEKGLHYLDSIADSVNQMGLLIDNLLNFSRTGRAEMRLAPADMNVIFKEALEQLNQESAGRAVEWTIGGFPRARCDAGLLKLVWTNLLSNALKYSRQSSPAKIEAGCREEGGELIFFVKDNGAGFDMRYAKNLFGVFQRLHTQAEFEGTGIGLANVRRIIARHGGRTWAEAELGKGAAFYFTLPKNTEEASHGAENNTAG